MYTSLPYPPAMKGARTEDIPTHQLEDWFTSITYPEQSECHAGGQPGSARDVSLLVVLW